MIKCIIFDCDGTLVDSELLFNRALSEKLYQKKVVISAEELVNRFRGIKLVSALEQLEKEHSVELNDEFIEDYRNLVEHLFTNELVACHGVVETLTNLSLAMCVASNGPLEKMQLALSVTGLSEFFGQNIFSAYTIQAWKPEPKLFLHAAKRMGYKPSECLVLEDSLVGIKAAKTAGMKPVLYDPNDVHSDSHAIEKIRYFSELTKHI